MRNISDRYDINYPRHTQILAVLQSVMPCIHFNSIFILLYLSDTLSHKSHVVPSHEGINFRHSLLVDGVIPENCRIPVSKPSYNSTVTFL